MSNGRVDTTLEPSVIEEVLALVSRMEAALPFLVQLSAADRERLVKPHPGAIHVAREVAALGAQAGLAVPPDDPMLGDLSVYHGLTVVMEQLAELLEKVEDTRLQAGSEAWNESLVRYGMLRQLAQSQPELSEQLDRLRPFITSRASGVQGGPGDDG